MKRSEWADTWLQQAKHDLEAARALRDSGFWDTCALMCQQAAEKAVKALWIDVKLADPPKTHRLEQLAGELGASREILMASHELVGDYLSSRYPDTATAAPFLFYSRAQAEDRLDKAESVVDWVRSQWEDAND